MLNRLLPLIAVSSLSCLTFINSTALANPALLEQTTNDCIASIGNPYDPKYVEPSTDSEPLGLIDVIQVCEYAINQSPSPSTSLRHSVALLSHRFGSMRFAHHLAKQLVEENYAAAAGIYLSAAMRSRYNWPSENGDAITQQVAKAKAQGYPRIDVDVARAYERLAYKRVILYFRGGMRDARLELIKKALDHYNAYPEKDDEIRFRIARLQIQILDDGGDAPLPIDDIWTQLQELAERDEKGAAFYVAARASIQAGKENEELLTAAINAFREAIDNNVVNALKVALLKTGIQEIVQAGVSNSSIEERLFNEKLLWLIGEVQEDDILRLWRDHIEHLGLDDMEIDTADVLQKGLLSGFIPAGHALINDHLQDTGSAWPILILASYRAEFADTYAWIRTVAMSQFDGSEAINPNELRMALDIFRRLKDQRDFHSVLAAASLLKRAGHEAPALEWLIGSLETLNHPAANMTDSEREYYYKSMLEMLYENDFPFQQKLYEQAAKLDGHAFATGVDDFLYSMKRANENDAEKLEYWQSQAYRFASFPELRERLNIEPGGAARGGAIPELAEALQQTKPVCAQSQSLVGTLSAVWDEKTYSVRNINVDSWEGYTYTHSSSDDSTVLILYLGIASALASEPTNDKLHSFKASDYNWIGHPMTQQHPVECGFVGCKLVWLASFHDSIHGDEGLRRARREGSSTISYVLRGPYSAGYQETNKSQTVNFDGFNAALKLAREKHDQTEQLFRARACKAAS